MFAFLHSLNQTLVALLALPCIFQVTRELVYLSIQFLLIFLKSAYILLEVINQVCLSIVFFLQLFLKVSHLTDLQFIAISFFSQLSRSSSDLILLVRLPMEELLVICLNGSVFESNMVLEFFNLLQANILLVLHIFELLTQSLICQHSNLELLLHVFGLLSQLEGLLQADLVLTLRELLCQTLYSFIIELTLPHCQLPCILVFHIVLLAESRQIYLAYLCRLKNIGQLDSTVAVGDVEICLRRVSMLLHNHR